MRGLEQIVAEHGSGLARVAASYEADRMLREDLTQEILIAIHRALPSLANPDSLVPFIYRIAHNRGVTHVARQAGARRADRHAQPESAPPQTPEERMLEDERAHRVTAAVRRLPLPYRQVMTLLLEDLSYAQIAAALDISLSNVAVRVNRAKAQLKAMLDDE